jgi:F0F1-type ATP synthase delta subunit
MTYKRKQLARIIAEKTLHVTSPQDVARQVAAYLVTEKRVQDLSSLMREVMSIRAEHGIVEAEAVTAFAISDKVRKELEQVVRREHAQAKTIILHQRHDEAVVGGVRLDLPAEQLDLTVHARMSKFKQLATAERSA